MVSFFRRKKPETPSGSESARRYSAEELAAAFPTAPAGGAVPAPVERPIPPPADVPPPAPVRDVVEAQPATEPAPAAAPEAHALPAGSAATKAAAERAAGPVTEPVAAPVAVVAEPPPSKPTPVAEPPADIPGVPATAVAAPAGKRGWRDRLRGSAFARSFGGLFYTNPKLDEDLLDQIETALITADVGVAATTELVAALRKRMNAREFIDAHALLLALREQLLALLRPVAVPLRIERADKPFVLLTVGVNGVGKTTTIGKLAKRFKDEGRPLMLAAGDTFRAAAVAQLQAWGERNGVAVIAQGQNADAASVAFDALQAATARNIEVLIADTAGRLHTQQGLMAELGKIKRVLQKIDPDAPQEVLMVIDGTTGQNALSQLRQFHAAVGVTGLVVTKLDGTAKGGVVFALAREFGIPIRFAGIGERPEDLRVFDAEAFVDALLPETLGA